MSDPGGGAGRPKQQLIDTPAYSERLRELLLDPVRKAIQLTRFSESEQAADLTTPPNCDGFGRVHHFDRFEGSHWPENPLPLDPAASALELERTTTLRAQVFQSAGCNWRCWYCYVPFADLTARQGMLIPVSSMVEGYANLEDRPPVVDLTGGQPDLTPEWPVWFIRALVNLGIDDCYVWSDDNLSTDYLWRYLQAEDIALLGEYPRYGRACCLKGYSAESFTFNTKAPPSDFEQQFRLLERLQHDTRIDFFVYMTITSPDVTSVEPDISAFVDRLQAISETLPLRTVPLRVLEWGPVTARLNETRRGALRNQYVALASWQIELEARFSLEERSMGITEVPR